MNRRNFLSTVPLALAATALTSSKVLAESDGGKSKPATGMSSPSVAAPAKSSVPSTHELDFATALQSAEAIRTKQITSVELTERMFARIDHYNPQLNVFAYQLREDALAQARKADACWDRAGVRAVKRSASFMVFLSQ
jgi:hypothetical protein